MDVQKFLARADLSTSDGIYEALNRVNNDDKMLYVMLRRLMMKKGLPRQIAQEALESICYFFTDSPYKYLARLARDTVERLEGVQDCKRILDQFNGDIAGLQMANFTGQAYILFLPDASEPGRVRYSCFDKYGFYSHATFDDYNIALKDAWRCGFREVVPDVISEMSATAVWAQGSEMTAKLQSN